MSIARASTPISRKQRTTSLKLVRATLSSRFAATAISITQMFDALYGQGQRHRKFAAASVTRDDELTERNEYFTRLEPQFNKLRAECEHLLQLNQRAMLAKSEAAAGVAQLWFYRTLLFAGVLVVAGLLLAFFLANRIVEPLRQLTATTARMAGGDLNAK